MSTKITQQLRTLEEFQQLKTDYDEAQAKIRKEYESKSTAVNTQISSVVNEYNTVVRNTLKKFMSDYSLYNALSKQLLIPASATLTNFDPYSGEYVFTFAGSNNTVEERKIHYTLLRNDPIAVAQHTRKAIRAEQKERRSKALKDAYQALKDAKTAYEKAKSQSEAANRDVNRLEKAQKKRSEKALKARTAQREKEKLAS